jgi:hypothetical protein
MLKKIQVIVLCVVFSILLSTSSEALSLIGAWKTAAENPNQLNQFMQYL